jgi:hypothetical protein
VLGRDVGTQGIFWGVTARVWGEEKLKNAHADLARSREDLLRTLADLQRSHNRFKEAQLQIIEMEKMQSIGQMAAGIAHEVRTRWRSSAWAWTTSATHCLGGGRDHPDRVEGYAGRPALGRGIMMGLLLPPAPVDVSKI